MSKLKLIFVIQKHDAKTLHYDFRIEVDGVLKSWVVPRGLSFNPKDKRLAIETEDHKLSYAKFEGVIPEGEYGAGTVMVWDRGTYRIIKEKDGEIEIWLDGEKMNGGFVLVRMKDKNWLFIKMKDEFADARRNPVLTQPKSVLTGRTMKQIEGNVK